MTQDSPPTPEVEHTSARRPGLWLALLVVALLTCLRGLRLEADTPSELASWSVGLMVDEGYKTLDARNRVLFDQAHWHPADDYAGWSDQSSLTQWAYAASFRAFGVSVSSARLVSIGCFVLFATLFVLAQRRRYSLGTQLLGLALLGTQATIFFFSRIAIFEFPLIVFLYAALFVLAHWNRLRGPRSLLLIALCFALATFGVKASGPIYFFPLILGLVVAKFANGRPRPGRRWLLPGLVAGVLLGLTLWFTRDLIREKFGLSDPNFARVLFWSPMMFAAAPLATLGLACAFHALLVDARRYLGDPYRAALLSLVVLGPLCISVLAYHPLRYYVPLFPAYVLLVVEWFHLRTWRAHAGSPSRAGSPPMGPLRWIGLTLLLAWCIGSLELALQKQAFTDWESLGRRLHGLLTPNRVAASSLGLALLLLVLLRRWLSGPVALVTIVALQAMGSLGDARLVSRFLLEPQYRLREISSQVERLIPEGKSLGGSWAPIFTLGTGVRSLYMNMVINRPARLVFVRPDYLLVAGTSDYYRRIKKRRDVEPGEPTVLGTYARCEILVVPLTYTDPPPAGN